jgi:excisionase family DNA binding protein
MTEFKRPAGMSVQQAAAALTVCQRTVWQLIKSERIRTVRIGKRRIIPDTEIARMLAEGTTTVR